jgi:hypothetical protein
MKIRTMWLTTTIVAVLVLAAGGAGALASQRAPEDDVTGKINYQGRLTNPSGVPLDGTFPMRFQLYDDATAGSLLWDSGTFSVDVNEGLFSVDLAVDPYHFDGQGLWLRIYVNGDWLTPRQELVPVPYALSLRPGAEIQADASTNWVFRVGNVSSVATGSAIWGNAATGSAVYGNSEGGYGLSAYSSDGNALRATAYNKTAGVFFSTGGYGIQVTTNGTDHWDHAGYFTSNMGYGVYGVSAQNYGVRGEGNVAGVRGIGNSSGVSGSSDSGDGVSGWSNTLAGVYGSSDSYYGVEGNTWKTDNNYGLFTYDNLYSLNIHSAGAIMHLAQNSGDEPLEPGDVVVFAGIVEPEEPGGPLIIQVTKAAQADSPAVAGVVYRRFNVEAALEDSRPEAGSAHEPQKTTIDGPVPVGEHLLLVVQGPVKVKANALSSPIQPGNLLSSAGQAGYAARANADSAAPGTVFGKALEALDTDRNLIYVFVTLQ